MDRAIFTTHCRVFFWLRWFAITDTYAAGQYAFFDAPVEADEEWEWGVADLTLLKEYSKIYL